MALLRVSTYAYSFSFRVKKRKRAEPIPRNAFPHVIEKVRLPWMIVGVCADSIILGTCIRIRG